MEGNSAELSADELSLPEAIAAGAPEVAMASFGKWHLSRERDDPNTHGWPHFAGDLAGQLDDYEKWDKIVDGKAEATDVYATTANVDDALAWIDEQDGPWFVWIGFNTPHSPYHAPPSDLHGYSLTGSEAEAETKKPTLYKAMIESMDTEMGRMLDTLGDEVLDNTWVVYVGDNGTPAEVNNGAYKAAHAKATLYMGGIHVPLVITGPGLADGGRRVAAQVDTVDLFSTILDLLDVDADVLGDTTIDGVSLEPYLVDPAQEPLQDWSFAELGGVRTSQENSGWTVRGERYKLTRHEDGDELFHDLEGLYEEEANLLDGKLTEEQEAAYVALDTILVDLLASEKGD